TLAYPTNVIHMATECGNKNHSAAFPQALPEWFIKLFSDEGDWILDPFVGSGTTLKAARDLGRNALGIDLLPEYCAMAEAAVADTQHQLFEERATYDERKKTPTDKVHRKSAIASRHNF
ncbi:MAG: site-specific DNA-methyltransferase, partial [Rugosibacter sp.]